MDSTDAQVSDSAGNSARQQSIETNKTKVIACQMAISELLKGVNVDLDVHLAPTICWHLPGSMAMHGGDCFQGIDGVTRMLTKNIRRFYQPETIEVEFRSLMAEADLVHMHFGMTALTPAGQTYKNDYQILFQVDESGISNVWEYFDAHRLIQTLDEHNQSSSLIC
ncbi:Uncharacterised protein [BD1-7 clade bacterium]|uniref:SnoaL-like domain-containing protein n=1 Tax=BD1-7 clade bacterium TaxID=2029982 RepID=A0A5S9Q9X7_9GAMM|nr:Uncharacterised protein [BD1-7 clade bacterium]